MATLESTHPLILFPHDLQVAALTISDVGGKGFNLARLQGFGFRVPRWFAVSSRVCKELLEPHARRIATVLSDLGAEDLTGIESASHEVQSIVRGLCIPESFETELRQAFQTFFPGINAFSVRSSIVDEDSDVHSFAGQMDSYLDVPRHRAWERIRDVWASAYSPRALLYRLQNGLSLARIAAAVVVQEMIEPLSAGVLFTRDPQDEKWQFVIVAGYGLGEGVVSGQAVTDTYTATSRGKVIRQEIGKKDIQIKASSGNGSGTYRETVPEKLRSSPVLTDPQIRRLCRLGRKAERLFGLPLDIEWAMEKKGDVLLLQARPITFRRKEVTPAETRVWDNSNIVESYPGLTLPLTFSIVRQGYGKAFRTAAMGFLLFKKPLRDREDIFRNMIGLVNGRVYYNLLNWYEMLSYLPGFRRRKASWDRMIGISTKLDFPPNRLSPIVGLASASVFLFRLCSVRRNAKLFFRHFDKMYRSFADIDMSTASEHELLHLYADLSRCGLAQWHRTLYNDLAAMTYYDLLRRLCSRSPLASVPNLANNLLCGEKDVESVAPVRSLADICRMVSLHPKASQLLDGLDDRAVWDIIQKDLDLEEIRISIHRHLGLFGDRSLEELKLENRTFREDPATLIRLIRSYCRSGDTLGTVEHREKSIRKAAEESIRKLLRNPARRLLLAFVLNRTRSAVAGRENMRFARTRLYGIVRKLTRRMAGLFVAKGLLKAASDFYYLTIEEVFDVVRGASPTGDLQSLVELRRNEYARFSEIKVPDRFVTTGIPDFRLDMMPADLAVHDHRASGTGCSSGIAHGIGRIIRDPATARVTQDSILIARSTDPGWVFLMINARGIIAERGSILSHTAIIGRELGIPTIVGVSDATRIIPDGAHITMDGATGDVQWQ